MDLHFLPLDDSRSVRRGGKRSDEPANRHLLSVDAAIAGAVLLCAKLQWGLDDEVRVVPADAAESAWTEMPSQKAWLKALEHLSHLPKVHSEVELLQ